MATAVAAQAGQPNAVAGKPGSITHHRRRSLVSTASTDEPHHAPPTVIFHRIEREELEPPPRWDASRGGSSLSGARSMPSIKPNRLSEVALEDTRREAVRRAARASGGWDVGQRPTSQMAYIEYPEHERVDAMTKDAYGYESAKPGRLPRYIERRNRHTAASQQGWGSANTQKYRPLGEVDPHLDPVRFIAARHATQLRIVHPEAEEKEAGDARLLPLMAGRRISARVHKHSYAFYSIDVQPGLVLRVKVTTLRGDPDLYVSNRTRFPTHEDHVWRATGVGDDLIKIDPDHPDAMPGTYYVSVFGLQETDFTLEAALVPKDVKLPRRLPDFHSGAMQMLQREVAKGVQQRKALRSGGSLLSDMTQQLEEQGVRRDELTAAAAPVDAALKEADRRGRADANALAERAGKGPPGSAAELTHATRAVHATLSSLLDRTLEPRDERRARGEVRPRRQPSAEREPLEPRWKPPEGLSWADMPRETRVHLASSEYRACKRDLHAQLQQQLVALAERRPAKYQLRMRTMLCLENLDPSLHLIADQRAMRGAATAMHATFMRARPAQADGGEGGGGADGAASPSESAASPSASRKGSPRAKRGATPPGGGGGGGGGGGFDGDGDGDGDGGGGGGDGAGAGVGGCELAFLDDPFADDAGETAEEAAEEKVGDGSPSSASPSTARTTKSSSTLTARRAGRASTFRSSAGRSVRSEQIDLVSALDELVPSSSAGALGRHRNSQHGGRASCTSAHSASP